MKFKNTAVKCLQVILFCLCLCFVLAKLSDTLQKKTSDLKNAPFFKQTQDFDVLFFGTSHMKNGIYPMELWNEYGMVSYNFGESASAIATDYWIMKNALDYTTPKLVVIDAYPMAQDSKLTVENSWVHCALDAFPITPNKIRGVLDLCDDPNLEDRDGINYHDNQLELIWDFGKYHSRWNDLTRDDFTDYGTTKEKGGQMLSAVVPSEQIAIISGKPEIETDNVSQQYLRKIIEECQNRNIDVLLIYMPCPATESTQREANTAKRIAQQYGVNFLSFLNTDIVNTQTDFFDSEHLNASGARKITSVLGAYIIDNYEIPDQKENPEYDFWNHDYSIYQGFKDDFVRNEQNLNAELMLLADQSYSTEICVSKDSVLNQDELFLQLIENIAQRSELTEFVSDRSTGQENTELQISVKNRTTGELVAQSAWECSETKDFLRIEDEK